MQFEMLSYSSANVCRICLAEREDMSKSLFEFFIIQNSQDEEFFEQDEISFSSIYCELTGCLITEENNQDLTSSVCEECSEKLLISYELRKRSSEIESKIQEYCRLREEQQKEMENQIVEEVEFTEEDPIEEIIEEPKEEIVEASSNKKVYLIFDEEGSKDDMKMELFLESKTEDGEKFVCPLCPGRTFKVKRSLKKHIRIHLQDKRYQCQHCEERFIHASTRDQHQIKQHQPKDEWKFCCPFDDCDQRFYRRDKMRIHIKSKHTLEYNFKCDIPDCRAKFVEKSALNKHVLTHNPEKTFLCPICPNQYKMKKNLVYHLKAAHGQEGESLCAELVEKKIPKIKEEICEGLMETLIEEVDQEQPPKFVCELCGAKFREIRKFKDHKLKHGKKIYECDVCGKKFNVRRSINDHMRGVHMKIKNHQCLYCSYQNDRKDRVEDHQAQHFNPTPYSCELCENKKFGYRKSYESHMKLKHKDPKNYQCHLCFNYFLYAQSLKRHLKRHEEDPTFFSKFMVD